MIKNPPLTEDTIRKIIVRALLENNGFLLGEIKNSEARLEAKFETELDSKIGSLAKEMNVRFDQVYDSLQEIMGTFDQETDQKVEKLRSNLEPRIKSND